MRQVQLKKKKPKQVVNETAVSFETRVIEFDLLEITTSRDGERGLLCKFCKTYLANTKTGIERHETSKKHIQFRAEEAQKIINKEAMRKALGTTDEKLSPVGTTLNSEMRQFRLETVLALLQSLTFLQLTALLDHMHNKLLLQVRLTRAFL